MRPHGFARLLALGTAAWLALGPAGAQFAGGPAQRAQAAAVLAGGAPAAHPCLTPRLQLAAAESAPAALRRAAAALLGRAPLRGEREWIAPSGTAYRYTLGRTFDAIPPADADGDQAPDLLEALDQELRAATQELIARLGVSTPALAEIVLADLGRRAEGYATARGAAGGSIVLNASLPLPRLEQAALHQWTHLALQEIPAEWAEALATWAEIARYGLEADEHRSLAQRLARLREGLFSRDLTLAAGNALWVAFFEEAYGAESLPLLVRELAHRPSAAQALEAAVQHAGGQTLAQAFRDFHLWCVLTGALDDGRHFPFGRALPGPAFAASVRGVPALSVRSEPPVAAWGATQVRLDPELRGWSDAGLVLLFEGDVEAAWDVDLLVAYEDGGLQRVRLDLDADERGEVAVPAGRVREAVLLIRNLGGDEASGRRYTWWALVERGFPFSLASFEARPAEHGAGVLLEWETNRERDLLGFNVLRYREEDGAPLRVNPVWIPAVGDDEPMGYSYADLTAEPGTTYTYRLEGITRHGLKSLTDPVRVFVPER